MHKGCINMQKTGHDYLQMTNAIAVAFLSHNAIRAAEVGELMSLVHTRLLELARLEVMPKLPPPPTPVVPVANSIMPERLVCLDCGRRLRALKFHLRSHGLTPETYRAKWALPLDYPSVAPKFSEKRSTLARASGFGHHRTKSARSPRRRQSSDEAVGG